MNKLQPGQMAFFYHRSELTLGLITAVHDNLLEIHDIHGNIHRFPHSRLCLISKTSFNKEPFLVQLKAFEKQMQEHADILREIQALMSDYQGRSFAQIIQALEPLNDAQVFVAFQQLSKNSTLFSHKKAVYRLLTPSQQAQAKELQLQKQERQAFLAIVQKWLNSPQTILEPQLKAQLAKELRDLQQEDVHHDLAAMLKKQFSEYPAKIIELRRNLGDLPLNKDQILDASGLPILHSEHFWQDIPHIAAEQAPTAIEAFSVDDPDTQDYDDAISFSRKGENWLLGVHISELASVLSFGSPSFEDAISRASSMYLPHTKINMLPAFLCEDRCSLIAAQPRPVLSLYCEIDAQLQITAWHFELESIKVKENLSYKDVDALISNLAWSKIKLFTDKLHSEREFASQKAEYQYQLKVKGNKIRMVRTDLLSPARLMMEELMILYNRLFAAVASDNMLKLIYRNINSSEAAAPALGSGKQYASQAYLSSEPKYHNGIGAKAYLHATSPIRRAVDLINQAQFGAFLKGNAPFYSQELLETTIQKIEKRLRRQKEIQRKSERYWLLKYLQENWLNTPITAILVRSFAKACIFELIPWGFRIMVDCDIFLHPGEEVKLVLTQVEPLKAYCKADLIS